MAWGEGMTRAFGVGTLIGVQSRVLIKYISCRIRDYIAREIVITMALPSLWPKTWLWAHHPGGAPHEAPPPHLPPLSDGRGDC